MDDSFLFTTCLSEKPDKLVSEIKVVLDEFGGWS